MTEPAGEDLTEAGPIQSTSDLFRQRQFQFMVVWFLLSLIGVWLSARFGNILIDLVILIVALGLLVTSADQFMMGAKGIARKLGIAEIIIGLTIVSIGTSLPEILVSSTASYQARVTGNAGLSDFALAAIYGSVLVQITLILGIVVLITPLSVKPSWLKRDGVVMLGAILALTLLILDDHEVGRLEGLFLCLLYVMYLSYMVIHRKDIREEELSQLEEDVAEIAPEEDWTRVAYGVILVIGLGLAMWASNQLVASSSRIAIRLGVSEAVIGVTLAAAGTSLPELTVGIMAAKKSGGVAIGTLVGSNITDPLLSIGIAAMVNPIGISSEGSNILLYWIVPATLASVALALLFMWSSLRFDRWEGIVLVTTYAVFTLVLLILMLQKF